MSWFGRPGGLCTLAAIGAFACEPLVEGVDASSGICEPGGASVYPLEAGAWWRDRVVDEVGKADCPDKVVSIGQQSHPPGRPDVEAWPARSERETKWGLRWQEVTPTGVLRVADEWFDWDDNGVTLDVYCPYKTRMLDGGSVCVGDQWTEHPLRARITPTAACPKPCWDHVVVDPTTCQLTSPPGGFKVEVGTMDVSCTVEGVNEEVETSAGTFDALRVRCVEIVTISGNPPGEPKTSTYWWARGVGKVREHPAPPDGPEVLVSRCLPSEGCTDVPPNYQTMKAACPE